MTLSPRAVMSQVPLGTLPLPVEWLAPGSPAMTTAARDTN